MRVLRFDNAKPVKFEPLYNLGAGLDILNGKAVIGKNGDILVSGGLSRASAVCGLPHHFKSTFLDSAVVRMMARYNKTIALKHDTETHSSPLRGVELARHDPEFIDDPEIVDNGRWMQTSSSETTGSEAIELYRNYTQDKYKSAKDYLVKSPFVDTLTKKPLDIIYPSIYFIDSFSKLSTDMTDNIQEKDLGDDGAIRVHQVDGGEKKRIWQIVPPLSARSNTFFLTTAHLSGRGMGDDKYQERSLKALPAHLKVTNVGNAWEYNTTDVFYCHKTLHMMEKNVAIYPETSSSRDLVSDNDLQLVTIYLLRSKNGKTAIPHDVIISQSMGVQWSLTEYHNLRTHEWFGIEGSHSARFLTIYPEVKFTRNTIREVIKNDPKFCRALSILNDLWMIKNYWTDFDMSWCVDPKELYENITKLGYNWDFILEHTVNWWKFDDEHPDKHTLSTPELLKINQGLREPWWLSTKGVKEQALLAK